MDHWAFVLYVAALDSLVLVPRVGVVRGISVDVRVCPEREGRKCSRWRLPAYS